MSRPSGDSASTNDADMTTKPLPIWWWPIALAGMAFVLQCRPIHDVDIFWQIRLGELALAQGNRVDKEPFSASHIGETLSPFSWMGQIVFGAIFQIGGWEWMYAFDSIIWVAGFAAASLSVRRSSLGGTAVALALGFTASLPFASLRPQSFAVLAFGSLLVLMRSQFQLWKKLATAVPLLILWQNLHPSVSIAVITASSSASVGWIRYLRDRRTPMPWTHSLLAALAALAMFTTPAGFRLLTASAYNAQISRELGISEWLPLWHTANRSTSFPAWVALAATIALLLRGRRQVNAEDLGVVIALTVLMLSAYRFAPFWALAMIPVWTNCLANGTGSFLLKEPRRAILRPFLLGCAGLAIGIALATLVRPRLFAEHLPLDGLARLKSEQVSGNVYCHPPWGGPLIFTGYPDWRVTCDGRYYVYSRQEWQHFRDAASGQVPLAEMDDRYRPAAYFLQPIVESGLIDLLRASDAWIEIHADPHCVIFVRAKRNPR